MKREIPPLLVKEGTKKEQELKLISRITPRR
jgi:hypothetical protein